MLCLFQKVTSTTKTKPCQEAYKQSSGVGMHQNPHFQLKPITNWKNPEIRVRSTIAIPESAFGGKQVPCAKYQESGILLKWIIES